MKVLGFDLSKNKIRYSLLEGDKQEPILVEKKKLKVLSTSNTSELMNWFETEYDSLITRMKPDKVAYRLSLEPRKDQMFYLTYPYGVLELLCFKKNIPVSVHTTGNFVPSKFGLSKDADIFGYCDTIFGVNKPYWDKNQKYSLLSAWLNL